MYCIVRASSYAVSATDAFGTVWRFMHVDAHLAFTRAQTAVDAPVLININLDETNLIEQSIKGTQRADVFAEWPVDENRADHDGGH